MVNCKIRSVMVQKVADSNLVSASERLQSSVKQMFHIREENSGVKRGIVSIFHMPCVSFTCARI